MLLSFTDIQNNLNKLANGDFTAAGQELSARSAELRQPVEQFKLRT